LEGLTLDKDRRRTAIAAVALAATIVIIVAMFLTVRTVDIRDAKIDAPPGDWPTRDRR
jgi:uncharacterized membrane protein